MKTFFAALLLLLNAGVLRAQPEAEEALSMRIAQDFIAEYNRGDYDAMHARLSTAFKVLIGRKKWAELWTEKKASYGRITTGAADIKVSGLKVAFPLRYADDTAVREDLSMSLSSKGVIQGLLISPDPYGRIVPKPTPPGGLAAAVDSVLAEAYPQGFNGTVLYAAGNEVVFQKTVGYANMGLKIPLNDSSVFELASTSKQFTAAAILKLQESGKLSMDDSLQKFFPELHRYRGIKVRHLIHHTGGLPAYENYLAGGKVKKDFVYNADVIRMLADRDEGADFPPGSHFQYSNTGYAVLAAIVEKAAGMSYGDFLQEQFFRPLGMRHTRVYNTRRTRGEVVPNYAYGYVWSGKKNAYILPDSQKSTRYVVKLDGVVGDGAVNTTAPDLAKWAAAMTRPGAALSETSLRAVSTPDTLTSRRLNNYGYGVLIGRRPVAGLILGHNGSWPGYETLLYRFPERNEALIILCNREHPDQDISKAARELAGLFLGR